MKKLFTLVSIVSAIDLFAAAASSPSHPSLDDSRAWANFGGLNALNNSVYSAPSMSDDENSMDSDHGSLLDAAACAGSGSSTAAGSSAASSISSGASPISMLSAEDEDSFVFAAPPPSAVKKKKGPKYVAPAQGKTSGRETKLTKRAQAAAEERSMAAPTAKKARAENTDSSEDLEAKFAHIQATAEALEEQVKTAGDAASVALLKEAGSACLKAMRYEKAIQYWGRADVLSGVFSK